MASRNRRRFSCCKESANTISCRSLRMPGRERVAALVRRVEEGRFIEALQEFYAADATMQETGSPPRVGLRKLVEHERGVMAAFSEIRTLPVKTWLDEGAGDDINWGFALLRV